MGNLLFNFVQFKSLALTRQQISHRAGRHKQCRLLAEQGGRSLLQLAHGRILPIEHIEIVKRSNTKTDNMLLIVNSKFDKKVEMHVYAF